MSIESPPALKRLDHIQALRGIAALMVVVSHLLIIERKYSVDQILGDWAVYGMAGVDLFFVISGFIMIYVMWDRPRGLKAAGEFLWGRASRIYPLYWLVSLALLALWIVRPDIVFSSIEAPPNILKSFALYPSDKEPLLLAVGWTLVHEMYFYLVFAFIVLLPRKAMLPCLIAWTLVIFIFNELPQIYNGQRGPVFSIATSTMTLEFLAGAYYCWFLKYNVTKGKGPKKSNLSENITNIIILVSIVWLIWALMELDGLSNFSMRALYLSLPLMFLVGASSERDRLGRPIWQPLVILGDWSYALYLTHVLSLTVMGRIWARFSREGLMDNIAILFVMVAMTIFISGLIYKYIERPIIKAARKTRGRLFN